MKQLFLIRHNHKYKLSKCQNGLKWVTQIRTCRRGIILFCVAGWIVSTEALFEN